MGAIQDIAAEHENLTEWRRDIHAHPELGFQEHRTADFVAAKLQQFGLDVTRGLGGTGVVGTLRVGNATRAIGLRADMDALPIEEANQFAHRSTNPGCMHACGHDGHTTMLLGAAQYLAKTRNIEGAVHFIFQPAEEGLGGGEAMVKDGLFREFPVDAVFGMHNRPSLEQGRFAIRSGPMMAGGALFDVNIEGKGAHGARPESGIDPILAAAAITTQAQSIVSRNLSPHDTAVLSITQIGGGDAYNVIPNSAYLRGTARAFSTKVMQMIESRFRALAAGVAGGMGAQADLDFRVVFPPLVNSPEETAFAADTAAELVGEDRVNRNGPLIMASEDFSYMLNEKPGAYINIGNGPAPEGMAQGMTACEVHNPHYDFNDAILPLGSSWYARLAERWLQPSTGA